MLDALHVQDEVEVFVYLPLEGEPGEWDDLGVEVEVLEGEAPPEPEVKPVPDGRREFEWIACKVKELVTSGSAAPHEVAIVARTGRDDARRAHEILDTAGIPNSARIRTPLAEIAAVKAVLQLFRGAARGWSCRALRNVLESSYFELEIDLRAIDYIARKRRVEGLDGWTQELCRLRELVATARDEWKYRREGLYADRIADDCKRFDEFREVVEELNEPRPLDQWVALTRRMLDPGWFDFRGRVCGDMADATGAAAESRGGRALRTGADACWEIVRLDQRGVERLCRTLEAWPEAEDAGAVLEPTEWYARLRRFLESNELALRTPLDTGVQILEAHEAALFPFKHTFVVHANDGEFPRRAPTPVMFSDEERRALAERGLPLTYRELWLRRERALWRAVTQNPNVTISYRTADLNGVPLLPSLMLSRQLIDESQEIPRTQYTWPLAFNPAHARRIAAARLAESRRKDEPGPILVAEPLALDHAVLAAYAESQRRESLMTGREAGSLSPWNGEIRDEWLLEDLRERFGASYRWSASALETYSQCPFVFLLRYVLRLDELAEAEEETTPLTFGEVAHRLLERFHAEYQGPYPAEFSGATSELFQRIAEEVFAKAEAREEGWLGLPALWNITKRDLVEQVREYLAWELPRLKKARPERVELWFGYDEAKPVKIVGEDLGGQPQTLKVIGRVDRIDRYGEGKKATYGIIDYKTGRTPTTGWYEDGSALQAPVYMSALRGMLGDVHTGGYRSIRTPKAGGEVRWGTPAFERALQIALSIPGYVRAGRFEAKGARRTGWKSYWQGLDVCRMKACYESGSRFDE